ncbi:DUF6982 domain-containing protein [Edaphobacter dinghuensis]|uniref:Uncharacterized protein n=1 Tax=Edaphobacter dinghuensis TaxID=1560005 RepID=A0A917M0J2_9BACT|nr:hypothetical protein [Edaphobacter dinghuensis]GGG70080.1 hypothetical protein GCM10011585_10250 [Edaphobacter dinghuensis]
MAQRGDGEAANTHRIVVRYEDRAVRGFAEIDDLGSVEELLHSTQESPLESIRLRLQDSQTIEEVPTKDAKAVFFVKTFEGDLKHRALHFHGHAPVLEGLWVRVYFNDNEMIEGIVSNNSDFVLQNGFFLMPTDPNGNNKLVYVLKGGLKDFHVLGLRNPSKSLHKA